MNSQMSEEDILTFYAAPVPFLLNEMFTLTVRITKELIITHITSQMVSFERFYHTSQIIANIYIH